MARRTTALAALLAFVTPAVVTSAEARLPRDFFGIVPQTPLSAADTNRMRHGGVDTVRVPFQWAAIQPTATSGYKWAAVDPTVALLSRSRLEILPFFYGTPRWMARRETNMPVSSARQRREWTTFVRATVERYGTRGAFWREHWRGSGDFVPRNPIRKWQVWNEPNFFYFATPATPGRYAKLLKISGRAIRRGDRRAEVVIGGLFGDPKPRPPRGMDAVDFLTRLYRVRGIKRSFDGVALHPYAANVGNLRRHTERIRRVILRNRDRGAGLYLTEIGWGSQRNPRRVAFEVGRREQARALRGAYRYLIRNQRRLNLKQVHWFTWKDVRGGCSFCDSTGLFNRGARFRPKPAWHNFVGVTRGRLR